MSLPVPIRLGLASAALVSLFATALNARQQAEIPRYDAATFYQTTSLSGAHFSPDESHILYSSDATGVFNVWTMEVTSGATRQLTDSTTDACFVVGSFPADDRFLYSADQGGNELNHLYVARPGKPAIDLTPGDNVKARFVRWQTDDSAFYVMTNERDPKSFDLYRYEVPSFDARIYARELVFKNETSLGIGTVSGDGHWLALSKVRHNADNDILLVDLTAKEPAPELITAHEGDVSHDIMGFTPDGTRFLFTSNAGGEFQRIRSYALASGSKQDGPETDWDVLYMSFSRNGRYQAIAHNVDARTVVSIVDVQQDKQVELPELPRGDLVGGRFSRSETKLAFYVNGDTAPSNLCVLDLASGDWKQLTNSLNPAIDPAHLVESEVVRYPSFDELAIPALLYKPKQASAKNQVPALVWVHGGPGGQSRTGYNPMIQHLVNQGYGILAVNNRGSSGYGKTFNHMDDKRHGDVDLQDCIFGRRYLESLDWIDADKVGIIGGSYGGYMVAAALAFEPEAFEIGIDIFGVTNWLRTLENIPPWWEAFREALYAEMGDPALERERLHASSPLFHAKNIVKPLLVVQGANDPRVLKVESDELVEAVRANGVPVEYVLFEDEGHGFRNRENRIEASEAFVQFANEHLKRVEVE